VTTIFTPPPVRAAGELIVSLRNALNLVSRGATTPPEPAAHIRRLMNWESMCPKIDALDYLKFTAPVFEAMFDEAHLSLRSPEFYKALIPDRVEQHRDMIASLSSKAAELLTSIKTLTPAHFLIQQHFEHSFRAMPKTLTLNLTDVNVRTFLPLRDLRDAYFVDPSMKLIARYVALAEHVESTQPYLAVTQVPEEKLSTESLNARRLMKSSILELEVLSLLETTNRVA
jgi:hypothetical protein